MALAGRRVPRDRRRARRRATASSPAATPATTPTRRATASGSRSPRSSRASGRTSAARSGSSSGPPHQTDDAVQDEIRADLRARVPHPRPRRLGRGRSAAADTCVAPVLSVPEVVDDEQFAARGDVRRREAPRRTATFRQVGPIVRGHDRRRPARTRCATRPSPTPTTLLRAAGLAADECAKLPRRRGGRVTESVDRRDAPDDVAALIGVLQYEEDGRVPRRAGLHLDDVRVGRERQPALLGRRRRRRAHRRSDRAAHDAVGVVPPAPLGAGSRRAEKLPLQVHFDLKERFELPEAIMTDNIIDLPRAGPARRRDHERAESCVR